MQIYKMFAILLSSGNIKNYKLAFYVNTKIEFCDYRQ